MLRVFQNDLADQDKFIVTLELVPGREAMGRSVDTVVGIAMVAFSDGRIAVQFLVHFPAFVAYREKDCQYGLSKWISEG
jgi:methylenetetrahydrofolate reductase (NADH)